MFLCCFNGFALFNYLQIGTSFYVYVLIPLARSAPMIVIGALVHNSSNETFSKDTVTAAWNHLHECCLQEGIFLLGHVSDGDPRLRSADLDFCLKSSQQGAKLSLEHPLVSLCMPKVRLLSAASFFYINLALFYRYIGLYIFTNWSSFIEIRDDTS